MRYFIPFLMLLVLGACNTKQVNQTRLPENVQIGFYNVENLFDTIDNPLKNDDEFTPQGEKQYTTDRYQKKLENITRVFTEMGMPAIIGMCEVENEAVLKDLVQTGTFKDFPYKIVHFESPDERGIDNALIYRTDLFKVIAKTPVAQHLKHGVVVCIHSHLFQIVVLAAHTKALLGIGYPNVLG